MKKNLYIVRDIPQYAEDTSSYCYVIIATSYDEAIEIVRNKTGYNFKFDASLADNDDVWE